MSPDENFSVDISDPSAGSAETNDSFRMKRLSAIVVAAVACLLLLILVWLFSNSSSKTANASSSHKTVAERPKNQEVNGENQNESAPTNNLPINLSLKGSKTKPTAIKSLDWNGGYFDVMHTTSADAVAVRLINLAIKNGLVTKAGSANPEFQKFWEEKASKGAFDCPDIHRQVPNVQLAEIFKINTAIPAFLKEMGYKLPVVTDGQFEKEEEEGCNGVIDYVPDIRELGEGQFYTENGVLYEAVAFIHLRNLGPPGGAFDFYHRQPGSDFWEKIDDIEKKTETKIPQAQASKILPAVILYRKVTKSSKPKKAS